MQWDMVIAVLYLILPHQVQASKAFVAVLHFKYPLKIYFIRCQSIREKLQSVFRFFRSLKEQLKWKTMIFIFSGDNTSSSSLNTDIPTYKR
jgi:hypothetical protein